MRWLVFFLFIFNILVFAWFMFLKQQDQVQQQQAQKAQFDFSKAPSLELLSQLPEGEKAKLRRSKVKAKKPAVSDAKAEAGADQCVLIGPFVELISTRQIRDRLELSTEQSSMVKLEVVLEPVSWVLLPPTASREQAIENLQELRSNNIDSFLVSNNDDGYENAISLGVFSNAESAEKVAAKLKEQGYPAMVTQKQRKKTDYWLALDLASSKSFDKSSIEAFKEEMPEIKIKEKDCQSVAILETFE